MEASEALGVILSSVTCIISIFMLFYQFAQTKKMKELQMKSYKLLYIKGLDFGFMRNAGDDPCKIQIQFGLPSFSQNCDYLVK